MSLDRFEGAPNFYYREEIWVKPKHTEILVSTYFLKDIHLRCNFVNEYYDEARTIKVWRGR